MQASLAPNLNLTPRTQRGQTRGQQGTVSNECLLSEPPSLLRKSPHTPTFPGLLHQTRSFGWQQPRGSPRAGPRRAVQRDFRKETGKWNPVYFGTKKCF